MRLFNTICFLLLISSPVLAQQTMQMDTAKKPTQMHPKKPVKKMGMHDMNMDGMDMSGMKMDGDSAMKMDMGMTSQYSRDISMSRDGSGTSWVPDETPMYAYMPNTGKWMTMIHGAIFARYNDQDLFNKGSRGGKKFDAPDWVMAMTQRKIGDGGLFSVNTMFSFDPFLVGPGGYRLLFQTGESYKGVPLVDIQHPHDLFAELSLNYTQKIAKNADASLSFGDPGEPALGPPVFMHRLSAMNDPDAPLGHHYQDATHITFGVATLGLRISNVKLEGSIFTGREPDEFRYNFDAMRFDSYSIRLSCNPTKELALQVSNGWIKSPEALEPQQNVDRFTASAIYTRMLNNDSYIASTLVYGQNHFSDIHQTLPSILFENSLQLHKSAIYMRYEYVIKDGDELNMIYNANVLSNPDYNINAFTLGTNRILGTIKNTNITGGVQATLNVSPVGLKSLYGSDPIGFEVYIRINPAMMKIRKGKDNMMNMDM